MVGTLRRPAQSLVGASNTTSTSVPSVASRSINERSATSTSWITLITVPTRGRRGHPSGDQTAGHSLLPERAPRPHAAAASAYSDPRRPAESRSFCARHPSHHRPCATSPPTDRPLRGRSMTDPIIRLETTQLSVEPGGQGRSLVTVRNLGNIVEGFRLQVLGEGVSEWAEVTPAEVQVYPEQEATAVVVFSPPAGNTTRSGTFPFAVRAESVVDPGYLRGRRGRPGDRPGLRPADQDHPGDVVGPLARQALPRDHQLGKRPGPAEAHRDRSRREAGVPVRARDHRPARSG